MKVYQRGQIWLVNFDPSFGHEYRKVCPALIVENNDYIDTSSLLTIVPISSQTTKQKSLDVLLENNSQNRLMKNSLIKIKQVSSFDKRRFIKHIGLVRTKMMATIDKNLRLFLKL